MRFRSRKYSDEQLDRVAALYNEGFSYGVIAKDPSLGGVTRTQIAGLVNRMRDCADDRITREKSSSTRLKEWSDEQSLYVLQQCDLGMSYSAIARSLRMDRDRVARHHHAIREEYEASERA